MYFRVSLCFDSFPSCWRIFPRGKYIWLESSPTIGDTRTVTKTIPVPQERFGHVHIDVLRPFPSDQGFRYVLTMMDRTTSWPEAVPLAETTADTILQAFIGSWVARYGVPLTVTSDRGPQFTSEAWRATLGRLGMTISTTTAYHPQSNGMVERFHRALKNALRCSVRASKSWTRSLPWVMLGLRNAPRMETDSSVAEVVFGTPLRVPGVCFPEEQRVRQTAKEQLQQARANVAAFTPETLNLQKFKETPFIAKSLRTVRFVYVRDDRLGKPSLAPRYAGPFPVKSRNWENGTFTLELGDREDKVAITRLKSATVPSVAV